MNTTADRLAIARTDMSLLGAVTADSADEVVVTTPSGSSETYRRRAVMFVARGSLNHFARLMPEQLKRAFADDPLAVFEQALVDSPGPLTVVDLKQKLQQAGIPRQDLDAAWAQVKKRLDLGIDVKVTKAGNANKYQWKGEQATRLGPWLGAGDVVTVGDPNTPNCASSLIEADSGTITADDLEPPAQAPAGEIEAAEGDHLLDLLQKHAGPDAPASRTEIAGRILRLGAALAGATDREIRGLEKSPEEDRSLVLLLLAARDRDLPLWSNEDLKIPSALAAAAVESAIGEVGRSRTLGTRLARFVTRVIQRTDLTDLPLHLVASAFIRAAAAENDAQPSGAFVDLADLLADRTKTSVAREWDEVDALITNIARGMNRLPLDGTGPRGNFLAALHQIRRKHTVSDLLWSDVDLDALGDAASGSLRRALLDPDIEALVVRPAVRRFVADCHTRHDLGKLIALRGSFAAFVDPSSVAEAMSRTAKDDRKAREWLTGLRQQERLETTEERLELAERAAHAARSEAEEIQGDLDKALSERDRLQVALNQAIESTAAASDAQLRQAKLDVLRTLANLGATIADSPSAVSDSALQQRVLFALRREGLDALGAVGEVVHYDPALHDGQGEHIEPGTPVSVGRLGYTYDSGDESVVLMKALVSTV